ncbi:phosphoribosylglycinamide formyltransferase [Thalassotalea aquiviva]|uniref:phosphoribosylglycinamide formyltransferase n=1 Tax=Thalassotalea aquiviva TaxID=3242415 RepID=UPI00352B4686
MQQSKRIVVLISGNGSNLQAIIDACNEQRICANVVGVVSNKADAYGLTRAKNSNIDHAVVAHTDFSERQLYDQELIKVIDSYQPDLIVLAGFMRILTPTFVQHFAGRLLNIHPSLLPKYQGLNTHQRAIEAGDSEHGVSVHFVTEELDGGPVILQAKVPVFDNDKAVDLAARVHEQEYRIYPLVIKWYCESRLQMKDGNAILDNNVLPANGYANDE